ncbi:MAG: LPS biosynthesis protein [Nitrospirales bacterium]|nr:MAG: LPS biosynthesis protein [Nitrospirales bacterium]
MSETSSQETFYQDRPIDLIDLWEILWAEKLLIVGVTLAFAIGSVIYALAQIDIYRSEVLLVPAEDSQPSNPLLSQLGAAAGLVGINSADNRGNKVTTAIATMQSREFIRQFIQRYDLKPSLFAGIWDGTESSVLFDSDIYNSESAAWVVGEPSDQEAISLFQSILSVARNQTSGLVTLAVEWNDPNLARNWASWLVQDVNALIKQQDLIEATGAIEYLQGQLQSTQLVEMQRAFYQLIESQTRIVMLADVREDYVFRIVDPAYAPENAIRPRRSVISIVGTFIGGTISLVLVYLLNIIRIRKRSTFN